MTVTFALAASLICALTVVPVLAYLFIDKVKLNVDADGEPKNSFWIRVYTPSITAALRNRWTRYAVVVVAFVLFILSRHAGRVTANPVHQHGLGEDPGGHARAAGRRDTQAVLGVATQAETILLAQPHVEIVQTSVPGEQ